MTNLLRKSVALLIFASVLGFNALGSTPGFAQDTLRIAYIDPLSGPFANVGDSGLRHFQFMADRINAAGGAAGHDIEIVAYDSRVNPKDAIIQLRKAIDAGIRVITQGNGSSVANALTDAVRKHNRRNPDARVLFLNYAAVDPALTNDKCNFWHFRFDAHVDMKMAAMTDFIQQQPNVQKVYLINQDYSFGKAVRAAANTMLAEKRPDIEIVGDELHPISKVKDFAPYIAKIQASGADTVITGNWGNDIALLVKAGRDSGLDVDWYTYYGGGLGALTAIGDAADGRMKQITEWHENIPDAVMEPFVIEFENLYGIDWYYYRVKTMMEMLTTAIEQSESIEPLAIALALEGMRHETTLGEVFMRPDDHQLFQPMFISTLSGDVKYDIENTGMAFITDGRIEAEQTMVPTTCEMERPE